MSQPHRVPHYIERSSRGLEYLLAFMLPLVLVRPFHQALGFFLALVLPLIYMRVTLGKRPGYLIHKLYEFGVPIPGLIDPRIKRLDR